MSRACIIAIVICPIFGALAVAGEFETRYWKAMNEGRDVSALAPILTQLAFPPTRTKPIEALRAEALKLLKEVETSAPLSAVANPTQVDASETSSDWPTLGGDSTHAGVSRDRGPSEGVEAWKFPVGWPWRASTLVHDDHVYAATPALDNSLLCLDLASGQEVWTAKNPSIGFNRQARAASSVIPLTDDEIAVFKDTHVGYALSYLVIDQKNGAVLRRVPAAMQEKSFQQPEPKPQKLVAHRIKDGSQVLVKSLASGRTWWRFPTGYLPNEPLLAWGNVFAAAADGTLWGLNLWGDQRVAWTLRNPVGWGAPPVEHHGVIYLGGEDGAVYALQANTGRLLWKTAVAQPEPRARQLFSAAAIANQRIYVGSASGVLYALDAATGKPLWKHDCGDWIRARPHVAGKVVSAATLSGDVVAVRDDDTAAKPLWSASSGRFPIYANLSGDDEHVLASTADLDVVAYQLKSGKLKWRKSLIECSRRGEVKVFADSMPDIMQAPVTVADQRVFFAGRTGFVIAADAKSGKRLWRFESGGRVSASPLVIDGRVFIAQVAGNQTFYALDAQTGRPVWSRQLGEVWAPPEGDHKQLFVGDKHHTLHCLNPSDGSTIWTRAFADGVYPAPALDEDTVYTGSWDGHYYALDRRNGRIRWAFSRPGRPYHQGGRPDSAAPILADGKVIVPSLGSSLVALDKQTGKMAWEWNGIAWRICNVTASADNQTVLVSNFGNAYEFPFGVNLFGLDLKTGRQLWKTPGLGGLTAPVITSGNRFVVGSIGSPFISGYQMSPAANETPRMLWRLKTGGVMYESLPAVSGDMGYFLSNDGWLRAIK